MISPAMFCDGAREGGRGRERQGGRQRDRKGETLNNDASKSFYSSIFLLFHPPVCFSEEMASAA